MKKFTKAEIDRTRDYFRSKKFQEIKANLGERTFSYFVVPQSQEPDLSDFVIRLTGEPSEGYVLGISDSVDPIYRPYAVAHEFIEFTEIGIETPNRCVSALEEELKLIPGGIKPDYVRMRARFFRNLISYCSKQPEFYTEDDLNQFRENLAKLEELVN